MNVPEAKEAKKQTNIALQTLIENDIKEEIHRGSLWFGYNFENGSVDKEELQNIEKKLVSLGYQVITHFGPEIIMFNVSWK